MITLLNKDCFEVLKDMRPVQMIFMDPPDNIGLKYDEYKDNMPDVKYREFIADLIYESAYKCDVMWMSYNAKHTFMVGAIVDELLGDKSDWEAKACVQTFTFGQHNSHDLGNNHRPLIRLMRKGAKLYPDAILIPSWRQLNGDKRANPKGRVPGDVENSDTMRKDCLPLPNWTTDDIERFLSKIGKKAPDECWEWTAGKRGGYGRFRIGSNLYGATRLMWRLTHGTDPRSDFVCHTCDNPGCCNPDHLFLGDSADNVRDKDSKGRGVYLKGMDSGMAKLCDEDVTRIFQSAERATELGARYNVTAENINSIRNSKTWTHITGPLNLSDVFNFPRVTGNSGQRRKWHKTQLHEGLYERCIKLCCQEGDTVCDLFAGTGTLARVAGRCGVNALLVEIDKGYCERIAEEHNLEISDD